MVPRSRTVRYPNVSRSNGFGDWWEANNAMHAALKEKGYPVDFVADDSFHAFWSGGRVLPETLRKTWAGWNE